MADSGRLLGNPHSQAAWLEYARRLEFIVGILHNHRILIPGALIDELGQKPNAAPLSPMKRSRTHPLLTAFTAASIINEWREVRVSDIQHWLRSQSGYEKTLRIVQRHSGQNWTIEARLCHILSICMHEYISACATPSGNQRPNKATRIEAAKRARLLLKSIGIKKVRLADRDENQELVELLRKYIEEHEAAARSSLGGERNDPGVSQRRFAKDLAKALYRQFHLDSPAAVRHLLGLIDYEPDARGFERMMKGVRAQL